MSLEQVVLIFFLVVLPFIQYLRRNAPQRTGPPKQTGAKPSANRQPLREQQPPPLQDAEVLEDWTVDPIVDPIIDMSKRQTTAIINRGNRSGLRRAIVLMTLIGPCRAASPHDLPDSGWSR